jgi:hypothetical protein
MKYFLSQSFLAVIGILIISITLSSTSHISAHVWDPGDWQTSATGLGTSQNEVQQTAGLGFIVKAESWPFLSLQGGVENAGWGKIHGPVGIELGQIKIPSSPFASLLSEDVDWSTNKMSFSDGQTDLDLWVSRLTPALLVFTSSASLQLLTGELSGNTFDGSTVQPRPVGLAYPKYVAFSSGGNQQVKVLTEEDTDLPSLDNDWLLLWYGANSHFVDTRKPLTYTGPLWNNASLPHSYAYQADTPILLLFENQPSSIKHSVEGGVEIAFDSLAGYVTILPLLGRDHPEASKTESWSHTLPTDILSKIQWWSDNLCNYPVGVVETYSYNNSSDIASITETFSYLNTCARENTFAPIPPMLAVARDSLDVYFSGTVTDAKLNTEFGQTLGIKNTHSYTWYLSGLKRYTDPGRIIINTDEAPVQLEQELAIQVEAIISAGHYAPWIFSDSIPRQDQRGDIYWLNPADVIYHLVEIASALPDGALKTNLVNYIKSERNTYPPEDIANLPLGEGLVRGDFSISGSAVYQRWLNIRPDVFLTDVPLFNFYALARYYELTGGTLPLQSWQAAQAALDRDMREQDWATFYWFKGFDDRRVAVVNVNRHFSGLVGYIKLARITQDQEAEALGRSLLAKAVVLRIAMAKYPGYLYSAALVELPSEPDWQVTQTSGNWWGHLFNYQWQGAGDDARQVMLLDHFGMFLAEHSGYMQPGTGYQDFQIACSPYLIALRDLTPELSRLLSDFSSNEIRIYIDKVEALFPHWYAAFSEGMLGNEHNLNHPVDSYQIFLAKAMMFNESPERLTGYLDIPWLHQGDLFYIHKLAETMKTYHGIVWEDSVWLRGVAKDQTIYLTWEAYMDLNEEFTWWIDYQGPSGDQPSPITGLHHSTRGFTLSGLTNNSHYTIKVTAVSGDIDVLTSNLMTLVPMKYQFYQPLIHKNR